MQIIGEYKEGKQDTEEATMSKKHSKTNELITKEWMTIEWMTIEIVGHKGIHLASSGKLREVINYVN